MRLQLPIQIPSLQTPIVYGDGIYLIGSCFTEHIHHYLHRHLFSVRQNSHGILFNPISVCKALRDVTNITEYTEKDLFLLDEYWHSWYHHSDFSSLEKEQSLRLINETIREHHTFLKTAKYVFITLGSAFAYFLEEKNTFVSNNHRAPAKWFRKDLLPIDVIHEELKNTQALLLQLNTNLKFVYTVSPVRHARDGVIENNRSKARLLEAVHSLPNAYYFPSYELVIDVLRDYRFYDADLVHPNYQATEFVWEQFVQHCIDEKERETMHQVNQLYKARHHKPKDVGSKAHKLFIRQQLELATEIQSSNTNIDLSEYLTFFNASL